MHRANSSEEEAEEAQEAFPLEINVPTHQ